MMFFMSPVIAKWKRILIFVAENKWQTNHENHQYHTINKGEKVHIAIRHSPNIDGLQ